MKARGKKLIIINTKCVQNEEVICLQFLRGVRADDVGNRRMRFTFARLFITGKHEMLTIMIEYYRSIVVNGCRGREGEICARTTIYLIN
jgi:hypothetical protein